MNRSLFWVTSGGGGSRGVASAPPPRADITIWFTVVRLRANRRRPKKGIGPQLLRARQKKGFHVMLPGMKQRTRGRPSM